MLLHLAIRLALVVVGQIAAVAVLALVLTGAWMIDPFIISEFRYLPDPNNDWRYVLETAYAPELFVTFFLAFYSITVIPALLVSLAAEWMGLRNPVFYGCAGLALFALCALLFRGAGLIGAAGALLGGLAYWLAAGRTAGLCNLRQGRA